MSQKESAQRETESDGLRARKQARRTEEGGDAMVRRERGRGGISVRRLPTIEVQSVPPKYTFRTRSGAREGA